MKRIRVKKDDRWFDCGVYDKQVILEFYTEQAIRDFIMNGDFEYIEEEKSLITKFANYEFKNKCIDEWTKDLAETAHQHEKKLHIEAVKKKIEDLRPKGSALDKFEWGESIFQTILTAIEQA